MRRNINMKQGNTIHRVVVYLLIVALLFLLLGLSVVGFFYASYILAVASIAGFFFGSLFEIFAVRPLYLLLLALFRKHCRKSKKPKENKQKQSPLDNAELMDEANYRSA